MRKAGDVLYIVMPAYNEEGAIADVVKNWIKLLDGKSDYSRLVIADSGSLRRPQRNFRGKTRQL